MLIGVPKEIRGASRAVAIAIAYETVEAIQPSPRG